MSNLLKTLSIVHARIERLVNMRQDLNYGILYNACNIWIIPGKVYIYIDICIYII